MASAAHKVDISWDRRPAGVVVHVVYDNARRLNVLNPPALLDLTEAFLSLAREDDIRVVVFSGAGGKAFIGGADINHMVTMKSSEDGRAFITLIHKLCQSIRDCPVPVICRAEGYTLGAGLEVAAACDMRIAADNAFFGMPEVKVGIPSVVEAALLPRLIGWGRTSRMLLTAENIDAAKAEAWGLVEEVVPLAELDRGRRALRRCHRRSDAALGTGTEASDAPLGAPVARRGRAGRHRRPRPIGDRRRAHRAHGRVHQSQEEVTTMAKTVRVGCHSGFWGDTETAAVQLVRHGNVDYLVSDYLAEVTMSIMAAQKLRNPQAGYATDFVTTVMGPLAREIADRKIKVITNAGGVNPQACRDAVLKACEAAGVTLKVAVVLGDDLLPRADELRKLDIREMDTGAELPAKDRQHERLSRRVSDRPRARRRGRRGDHRPLRQLGGHPGRADPCLRLEHGRP